MIRDDDGHEWTEEMIARAHALFAPMPAYPGQQLRVRQLRDDQCIFCGMNGLPEDEVHRTEAPHARP